jgi:hypothetical protein
MQQRRGGTVLCSAKLRGAVAVGDRGRHGRVKLTSRPVGRLPPFGECRETSFAVGARRQIDLLAWPATSGNELGAALERFKKIWPPLPAVCKDVSGMVRAMR